MSNWKNEDYVYRVAWRNIHDWVMAQLAFYETEIVDIGQVFLLFVTDKMVRRSMSMCRRIRSFCLGMEEGMNH